MDSNKQNIQGRVRENTSDERNWEIDQKALQNLKQYSMLTPNEIEQRLNQLNKEWDIEKTFEVNASSFALAGLILGTFVNKRWYLLSGAVFGFLLQHGIQGWCPPLPLFRALGVRTRQEIDEERYALKVLRGDFDNISASKPPQEILDSLRN